MPLRRSPAISRRLRHHQSYVVKKSCGPVTRSRGSQKKRLSPPHIITLSMSIVIENKPFGLLRSQGNSFLSNQPNQTKPNQILRTPPKQGHDTTILRTMVPTESRHAQTSRGFKTPVTTTLLHIVEPPIGRTVVADAERKRMKARRSGERRGRSICWTLIVDRIMRSRN